MRCCWARIARMPGYGIYWRGGCPGPCWLTVCLKRVRSVMAVQHAGLRTTLYQASTARKKKPACACLYRQVSTWRNLTGATKTGVIPSRALIGKIGSRRWRPCCMRVLSPGYRNTVHYLEIIEVERMSLKSSPAGWYSMVPESMRLSAVYVQRLTAAITVLPGYWRAGSRYGSSVSAT